MNIEYTIADALAEAQEKNIDALDAEILLSFTLDVNRTKIISYPEKILDDTEITTYRELIGRRAKHEPVAYLTGIKEFWSLEFCVGPEVLVPRPETECLVEEALKLIPAGKLFEVLEMATGSGAVSCALASVRPEVDITATDVCEKALVIAKKNIKNQGHKNIHVVQSDWFSQLHDRKFDMIIANPPYLAEDDPHLEKDIGFEPKLALVAGKTGMEAYDSIIKNAYKHLKPSGVMLFEHGAEQMRLLHETLDCYNYEHIETRNDYADLPRVTIARKS